MREADDPCPFNCTINGHHFCHPIPCPLPPCVDPKQDPGMCCPYCPNGTVTVVYILKCYVFPCALNKLSFDIKLRT